MGYSSCAMEYGVGTMTGSKQRELQLTPREARCVTIARELKLLAPDRSLGPALLSDPARSEPRRPNAWGGESLRAGPAENGLYVGYARSWRAPWASKARPHRGKE
jgi:hypothetical protein